MRNRSLRNPAAAIPPNDNNAGLAAANAAATIPPNARGLNANNAEVPPMRRRSPRPAAAIPPNARGPNPAPAAAAAAANNRRQGEDSANNAEVPSMRNRSLRNPAAAIPPNDNNAGLAAANAAATIPPNARGLNANNAEVPPMRRRSPRPAAAIPPNARGPNPAPAAAAAAANNRRQGEDSANNAEVPPMQNRSLRNPAAAIRPNANNAKVKKSPARKMSARRKHEDKDSDDSVKVVDENTINCKSSGKIQKVSVAKESVAARTTWNVSKSREIEGDDRNSMDWETASNGSNVVADNASNGKGVLKLLVTEGPHAGHEISFGGDFLGTVCVGKDPASRAMKDAIKFAVLDESASCVHAKFVINSKSNVISVRVTDMTSLSGTFVNGRRLSSGKSTQAFLGDRIKIGLSMFEIKTENSLAMAKSECEGESRRKAQAEELLNETQAHLEPVKNELAKKEQQYQQVRRVRCEVENIFTSKYVHSLMVYSGCISR